ncbi:sensor histidine kinase [Thermohalobacter berrensis]|uniref:histidine kinase n=1 Tax=Thermohalobacter berrensis TaxID=99594 RepID=A0A419T198_9FIRM|nr:sensor histidine kinase [Thermohalobacter berrensis]RKD31198.1 hypothetical protein BET03_03465 [Thermohalobacter berrensis]
MNNRVKLFYIFKLVTLVILFIGAIMFENAHGSRLYLLSLIFILYILIGILRGRIFKNKRIYSLSYFIDIALVYYLEHNSRFLINYFFHTFYIGILIESSLTLKKKDSLIIGIITVVTSLIKYVLLIYYKTNLSNISQISFFTLINVFILVLTHFAQYYKEEKEKQDKLYKQLIKAHKKLKEYADKIEGLTIIEERNRIARDLHDTLGHNMTALIMEMEMAELMINDDIDKAKELIGRSKKTAREGLRKVREVVETLRPEKRILKGVESIKELIEDFSNKANINAELNIKGKIVKTSPTIDVTLYRIVQESLTNAVRHGKASKVKIDLEYTYKTVNFKIKDNGIGIKKIEKGFGLKGMEERVRNINGEVKFHSDKGFLIEGYLPLEVNRVD